MWELRVYLGADRRTGKERTKSVTVRGSKREAQRRLSQLLDEVAQGKHRTADGTLGALLGRWMEHQHTQGRSPSTLATYRGYIANRIVPALGHVKLAKLSAADLDAFYAAESARITRKGTPVAPATIRQQHAILVAALGQAVKWGWLSVNPAAMASPPPIRGKGVHPPTPDEVRRLLEACDDPALSVFIWLAATTGARRGELCALRWDDLDLDQGVMVVSRSVVDVRGDRQVKDTKTHAARRLALDTATVMLLTRWREECDRLARENKVPSVYVFALDGIPRPDYFTQGFVRLARGVGLTLRLHDLRHFMATQAIAAGVDVRTVAGRLGHSGGGAITMRVYAHFLETPDRAAAEHMGQLLRPGDESRGG